MTFTEFSVKVPVIGKVDVVRQDDGTDASGNPEYFWDLFDSNGTCLNEGNAFYERPSRKEVLDFLSQTA